MISIHGRCGAIAVISALAVAAGSAQESRPATVNAVRATVTLGGGRAVTGAQGVALDPTTGFVYVALNGTIVGGCAGDPALGSRLPQGPGARQLSILDPARQIEVAAVPSGGAPVWPTVDPDRRVVYLANSGSGTMTRHDAATGATLATFTVGGKPHMGGLDYSTRLMLVSNTVRASEVLAEQNHATVVDTAADAVLRELTSGPAGHGVVVDQERDLMYMTAVGDGSIAVVNAATGQQIFSGIPNRVYGTAFGGNNMLVRQASTRRLIQTNSQLGAIGALAVDEVTLRAEGLIRFGTYTVWGMSVDEPNRLLFVALPNANAIGVADLDTLAQVATIPVGDCPYAVVVDPDRRVGVTSNQGSPTANATASIIDLCPVYAAAGRIVGGCSTTPSFGATNLLGLADGSALALAWKNTPGAATTMVLNVTGAYAGTFPLSSSAETFQYAGVPAGTHTFSVVATNTSGSSVSSNAVTLTFPGTCSPPLAPANVSATSSGRTLSLSWDPPPSGAAPTGYRVNVSGAYTGSVATDVRAAAGTVGAGSYTLSVSAANRCGTSAATPTQTITIQ